MATLVRCKCGWSRELKSTRTVQCPRCGHIIHVLDTDWRRGRSEEELYEEVTVRTRLRDLVQDARDLFYQYVLLHLFRVVSGLIIIVLLCWLAIVLVRTHSRPSPLREDYELALELIEQGKRQMAKRLLYQIIERGPTTAVARRAREQLTLLGEDPSARRGAIGTIDSLDAARPSRQARAGR